MKSTLTVRIPAKEPVAYPIVIGSGVLEKISAELLNQHNQIVLITDNKVKKLYGDFLCRLLKNKGYKILLLSFSSGEKFKNKKTKDILEEQMLSHSCKRHTLILALGGGVVGDLAGFIAATYMRGIPYIQIPTTLLAMVDSSVGGKTGIDTSYGKNLIGAFWQPKAVIADIQCLSTLPKKQLVNGLIEAVKIFLTCSLTDFKYLQKNIDKILNYDAATLAMLVKKSIKIKADIVQQDEREENLRMVLNFGHTMGHALELVSDYKILHGYAVAYGILLETKVAELMGLLSPKNYNIIESLMKKLGIQAVDLNKFDIGQIIQASKLDKKASAKTVNYILLKDLGVIHLGKNGKVVHPVPATIIENAFVAIMGESSHGR
ncbi:MAG: 3-dehydroquinate synthase [Gammaproteobacteria bacterium RIFCSPHIGHO2_12_FULL_41_15]|nr:MAG: 3-dehydroquinate synthase [Gammaproteobacteria bacterium RIFCSPHIGHO2_12_FULL_41_15]